MSREPHAYPYTLARDVHACLHDSTVVLLDLRRNRYFAVENCEASRLESLVNGWPSSPSEALSQTAAPALPPDGMDVLLQRGLVEKSSTERAMIKPLDAPAATQEWIADRLCGRPRISGDVLWHALRSHAAARFALKYRAVRAVVEEVRHRRECVSRRAAQTHEADTLLSIFDYLRPYLLSATNGCFLDSLTIANFLASYRLYPDLVFGVRTGPFLAHCWLQQEHTVLNDTVERVSRFTPIMVA